MSEDTEPAVCQMHQAWLPPRLRPCNLLQLLLLTWIGLAGSGLLSPAAATEQYWIYSVRAGDTLASLTEEYCKRSDDWRRIQQLNGLRANPKLPLAAGKRLRLPLDILKYEPATSRVVQLHGSVQVIRASGTAEALEPGAALRSGDRVITGPDSNVTLHFADGSQLLVLGDSEVIMDTLSAWSTTGMVDTRLRLQGGRVDTRVQPSQGPGSRYRITTPAAVAAVRGTEFRVAADRDEPVMRSEVTGGTVAVSGSATSLDVPAGFGLVSAAGQPAQAPRTLLPAPDLGANVAIQRHLPLRFNWQPVDDALAYRYQIAPDPLFKTVLFDRVVKQPNAELEELADGSYAIRVRAIDEVGLEGLDTVLPFSLDARPFAPLLSTPASGEVVREPRPQLGWQARESSQRYRLQLARDGDFSNIVSDSTVDQPGFRNDQPLQPGVYHWRVATLDNSGETGVFSAASTFTYRAPLAAPGPGRAITEKQHLLVDWQEVDGAAGYQLQLARDPGFRDIVHDHQSTTNSQELPRPQSRRYFYRVRAMTGAGEPGEFSATRQVDVPPRNYWSLLMMIPFLLL